MNLDYFNSTAKPELHSPEQNIDELQQLRELADKIGSYRWEYKNNFANSNGVDTDTHLGPVAQELLKVPSLAGAVQQTPDGTLTVNTNYAALAALGYVAALARIVLGDNKNDSNTQLYTPVSDSTGTAPADNAGTTPADNAGAAPASTEQVVQPEMETEETAMDVPSSDTDTSSAANATGVENEGNNEETY